MSNAVRLFLALLLASGLSATSGCSNKSDGQPNTDLQVPDVPAKGRGMEGKSKLVDKGNKQ